MSEDESPTPCCLCPALLHVLQRMVRSTVLTPEYQTHVAIWPAPFMIIVGLLAPKQGVGVIDTWLISDEDPEPARISNSAA